MVVSAVLLALAAASAGRVEETGDRLQVALPFLALGCAVANGEGAAFVARYGVMFVSLHGMKRAFGQAPFNIRPHGGGQGMPSGHTATAALGASRLVGGCLQGNPVAQAITVLAAGFTGGSRLTVGAHDIWQVLAGAVLGLLCDRVPGGALRRGLGRLAFRRGGRRR